MSEMIGFLGSLALALALLLAWSVRTLPRDGWQFLCAVPSRKREDGNWDGTNYTFYGVYVATSVALGAALFLFLNASFGYAVLPTLGTMALVLAFAAPAARWIARLVEKQRHTFTIGGASFAGLLALPVAVWLTNRLVAQPVALLPLAAALAVSYSLGEGLGRLACISFGCCFGRPLHDLPPWLADLFSRRHLAYGEATRKACYEANLANTPLLPIQAITASLYSICAWIGTALFLAGWWKTAFLGCLVFTQLWRFFSETLRADYRGGGKITAYQVMAILGIGYAAILAFATRPVAAQSADIRAGLAPFSHAGVLLFLQGIWLAMFRYMGRSTVTGARVAFLVHPRQP